MSALTIRNLPDSVQDALRRIAAEQHTAVEALARQALSDLAHPPRRFGIDFEKLARDRAHGRSRPQPTRAGAGRRVSPLLDTHEFSPSAGVQAQVEGVKLLTRDTKRLGHPLTESVN